MTSKKPRKHRKPNLTNADRQRIWDLHLTQPTWTAAQLAQKTGYSKKTIYLTLKQFKTQPPPPPTPPITTTPTAVPLDPLQFRLEKIASIREDMQSVRARGSVHVLPPLHRLEIDLHDQVVAIRDKQADMKTMDNEELLQTIVTTISQLPPLLRHRLEDSLTAIQTGAVLPFKKDINDATG